MIELLAQRAPLGGRQLALLLHQQLDEVAIAAIGRHAARGGVRLGDQAGFFERGQLVAHGGGRQLSLVLASDQVRGHRLRQGDVFLNDVAKDALSAGGQLGHSRGRWPRLALSVPEC